jgi:hypothetical protein
MRGRKADVNPTRRDQVRIPIDAIEDVDYRAVRAHQPATLFSRCFCRSRSRSGPLRQPYLGITSPVPAYLPNSALLMGENIRGAVGASFG